VEQAEDNSEILLRPLVWMGDALDNIRLFPQEVRTAVGYALQLVQAGETPASAKPFKGVASGVYTRSLSVMIQILIGLFIPLRLEKKSTFCTYFRKNRSRESKHHSLILT
jgi:hypothetical protein